MRVAWWIRGIVALAVLSSGCSAEADESADRPVVVVTTTILADVVSDVVGDAAQVVTLLPPGTDPHAFSASPAQAQSIADAALVVSNGLGLEEAIDDLIDAARDPSAASFIATDHIPTLAGDPHFWLDPMRMADVVRALPAELERAVPGPPWSERAAAVAADLVALDEEIEGLLRGIPTQRRAIVSDHTAFTYLADRYAFEVVAVLSSGPGLASASAADLDLVITALKGMQRPVILVDAAIDSAVADAVADEVGPTAQVVALHVESLTAPDGPAHTYAALLRTNATRLAEALG